MQVFGLPRQFSRGAGLATRLAAKTSDIAAASRREVVGRWRRAMRAGLSSAQAAQAVGVSRATLYRWERRPEPRSRRPRRVRRPLWTPALAQAVQALRADNPMWGKRKLAVLLRREGLIVSVSTVGRILRQLVRRGVVTPVPTLRRHPDRRRVRFTARERYGRRLPKGLKPTRPGEMVQIDTLFVNVRPDKPIKHFTAYDPVARWTFGHVATEATAAAAGRLLEKLCAEAPFPVRGVQVDGGSEFMAAFEQTCRDKGLALFVLPPKRPQLNGAVERAQAAWRYEFYASFDLPHRIDALQHHVDAFAHRYNHHRPHQALDDKTPAEYLAALSAKTPASHMT